MYVTTYYNTDEGQNGVFVRLNETYDGAWEDACHGAERALRAYKCLNGTHSLEYVEQEEDSPAKVCIINPHNGHEYERLQIEEVEVGE